AARLQVLERRGTVLDGPLKNAAVGADECGGARLIGADMVEGAERGVSGRTGRVVYRKVGRCERHGRVVVDGDDQGIGGGRHRVLIEVGGARDRAEVDGQVVLGVVTGQAVEARMVELVDQGEGPGTSGAVEREGEHRVRARRGGQGVADHRVGDGDAARGQR